MKKQKGLSPENEEEVLMALDSAGSVYGGIARIARKADMDPARIRVIKSGAQGMCQKLASALGYRLKWVREE